MANWARTALENGCIYTAEDSIIIIIGEYENPLFEEDCPVWVVKPRYGVEKWRVEVPTLEEAIIWADSQ